MDIDKPNPKWVGEVTESAIITELIKRKIAVSKPIGDNQRYDLIIDINSKLWKVQCKSLSHMSDDGYRFSTHSVRSNSLGWVRSNYIGQIDLFMSWHINMPLNVYVIPIEQASNGGFMVLRAKALTSNHKCNWHEDYLLDKWLKQGVT